MEKVSGIDKRRDFPVFKRSHIHKSPLTGGKIDPKKSVVLWSGCAAQYNDPLGEHQKSIDFANLTHKHQKSVAFLEGLGYRVIVPNWKCCNIAKITYGNFSGIEKDLDFNKKTLLPFAEENIPILYTSASCGYAFKDEYENYFTEDEIVKKIASSSHDIHDFLMRSYLKGGFKREFSPISMQIIYHEPCHLKSQQKA